MTINIPAGTKFGRLNVIKKDTDSSKKYRYICSCECGNVKSVLSNNLNTGGVKSCGCLRSDVAKKLRTKHGLSRARVYRIWRCMIDRCNAGNVNGRNYYGKGIKVCERWKISFDNFLADMGLPPEGTSIDRINNNGNYEPSNCRWATWAEQCSNKSTNVFIDYDGLRMTMAEWSRSLEVPYHIIMSRNKKGIKPPMVFGF